MKKLIFASLILGLVACKEEAPKDYLVFSGNILNMESDNLRVSSLTDSYSERIKLENGSFTDTLRIAEGNYMLFDGKNVSYVYFELGHDFNITYDVNDYKNTLKYSGAGSDINNYLVAKRNKEKEIIGEGINVFELNETDFVTKQKEIKSGLFELIASSPNVPDDFKEKEKRNIEYYYLNRLNNYEGNYQYYTNTPDFKTSEGFLKELEGLDYNNEEDFKFSTNYVSLINSHFNEAANQLSKSDSIPQDVAKIKVLNTLVNEGIKNSLAYKNAKYGIPFTSDLDDFYTAFMNASTNEEHRKEITESYNILKTVDKGQPSPKFVAYENNAGGNTSLEDLKGKYLYIDVWATWCGPCKAEIPYLKEITSKYQGKNIEFVSISLDKAKDHDKWKQMIVDESLGGVQLLADKDFNSDFAVAYFIKGIPKFILLDPDGIIVNSNAPRPSNEELTILLDKLII